MNAVNKPYTDKTYIYETDPAHDPGETARIEMNDVSYEFLPGVQDSDLLNFMITNSCSSPCGDPENEGFSKYDFESHCVVFRIIAKCESVDLLAKPNVKFVYDVKAVYVTSI